MYLPSPICSNCKGDDIREDTRQGMTKCVPCGCLFQDQLYHKVLFTKDGVPTHQKGPVSNLSISNNSKSDSKKLMKTFEEKDHSIDLASRQAKYICDLMGLKSSVYECAENLLYILRAKLKVFTGYNMEDVGTAVVIAAVNKLNLPSSMTKIIKYSGQEENKVNSVYISIQPFCDLPNKSTIDLHDRKETQLLRKYCSSLKISTEACKSAEDILCKILDNYWLNGKAGTKIGVAIWIALEHAPTKSCISLEEIAQIAEVAQSTIKKGSAIVNEKLNF